SEPRQLDLARARQAALAALTAYRAPDDPQVLLTALNGLAEDIPAHWLVTGLLSVGNQLLDYLARSEDVDGDDVLRAIAALEAEALEAADEADLEDAASEPDLDESQLGEFEAGLSGPETPGDEDQDPGEPGPREPA
ncbi:MAG: hypothetical protein JWM85_3479, partial [Acidimicrobiaceae bacterium]|nr:hypothetical protein [Acidimicrobiaceae bacterium]